MIIFSNITTYFFSFSLSLCFKIFLTLWLVSIGKKSKEIKHLKILLALIIFGEIFSDLSWMIGIINVTHPKTLNTLHIIITRLAWAFYILQNQSLAIFIEKLTKKFKLSIQHIATITLTSVIAIFSISLALLKYNTPLMEILPNTGEILPKAIFICAFIILMPSITKALMASKNKQTPKLVSQQAYTFIICFIITRFIIDFFLYIPSLLFKQPPTFRYLLAGITTLLMTYAIYFCMRRMLNFRFLNAKTHVETPEKFDFIEDFKVTLEQLGFIHNINELKHIISKFYENAFNIPQSSAYLFIRKLEVETEELEYVNPHYAIATESFLCTQYRTNEHGVATFLKKNKILIRDEIEFSNFYEKNPTYTALIKFLNNIDADIFLPIYERDIVTGYIIVLKNARKELYTSVDRDEMLVLTSYLSTIINLLRHRNLDTLIVRERELQDELFKKHQEINQYKESMHQLLARARERKMGFLIYKNNKFSYANSIARDLVPVDLNVEQGVRLTQQIRTCIKHAHEYKTIQTTEITDQNNQKLSITCLPGVNETSCTIAVYRPAISDELVKNIDQMHNPSHIDYRLYLETTQSGKLINDALPGNNKTLVQFKIDLLQLALSKKALLLNMSEEDLDATVDVIHQISLRSTLHTIELTRKEKESNIAITLFGINPLIVEQQAPKPLLEALHNTGTLYIRNIEFLDLETQEYLAEYLRYGVFRIFKSERKVASSVRIICTTNQNLDNCVKNGTFSARLLHELKKTSLTMPSLLTLPKKEVEQLAADLAHQLIATKDLNTILELDDKEKTYILEQRPISVHELKKIIFDHLKSKAKRKEIEDIAKINPACASNDPLVTKAARLGKYALKDKQLMTALWNKFQNQTKIANLLGVNRSSVNRRFKSYNLID